jgi:metal-responsive CopG/Arc/MetJ family transcriptional regulator
MKVMKVRTSVTLPEELLVKVDKLAGAKRHRSKVVESALVAYVDRERSKMPNKRDLQILNKFADILNKEAAEVLEYQAEW